MKEFLFIEEEIENVNVVSAENIEEAQVKYAKYKWGNDEYLKDYLECRTINMSFWESYFRGLFNEIGEPIYEKDFVFKKFKENLLKDFKAETAEELYQFFKSDKPQDTLSENAKIMVMLNIIIEEIQGGYLKIFKYKNINKIQ